MWRDWRRFSTLGWMRILAIAATALAMTVGFGIPARAQTKTDLQLLKDPDLERIGKPARSAYEEGIEALDHLNPTLGVQKLSEAADLAPKATRLQILTARAALLRARRVPGSGGETYLAIAEKALNRVAQQENLTPLQKQDYQILRKQISEYKQRDKTQGQDDLTTRPSLLPLLSRLSSKRKTATTRGKVVVKDPIRSSRIQEKRDKNDRDNDNVRNRRGNSRRNNRNRGNVRRSGGGRRAPRAPRGVPGPRPGGGGGGAGGGGGGGAGRPR